jgi:AAA15 family ATPase/GTPase
VIRLQSLVIEHFRGIREGRIDDLTDVNLLIGPNNCGKTSVLEAIARLAAAGSQRIASILNKSWDYWKEVRPGLSDELMWYGRDTKTPIHLSAKLRDSETDAGTIDLNISHTNDPQKPCDHEMRLDSALSDAQLDQFFSEVSVARPSDAFRIENERWLYLIGDRSDKGLLKALNSIFGLEAESVQMIGDQLVVLFEKVGMPLASYGDGTRAAVRTLIVLSSLRNTLLMLEEPETYQHPRSLARFADALCRLAQSRKVQLLISTHSIECVSWFLKAAKMAESDAAVFHLKLENGKQESHRLDPDAVETLTDTGVDVRFLDLYA